MRIAHVSDCYLPRLGGIEMQIHDLAARQHAAGHDVAIITSVAAADTDQLPGVRVHRPLSSVTRGTEGGRIRYSRSLQGRAVAVGGDFDVLHLHVSTFSPLPFLTAHAATRRGIPTLITLHSMLAYTTPLFQAVDQMLGWGDWPVAWSAVSEAAAAPLRRILAGRGDVAILPNGIDPAQWAVERALRPEDEVRLVSVMRLAPRKRPHQLLGMLRDVHRELAGRAHLSVDIVGSGPERRAMERFLRRHEMTRWVTLHGRLTRAEVRSLYAQADVFVAPATLESFGIAALEARSAGLPIVARAETGVQDFITHGQEGLLCHSDREMVEALTALGRSPALRSLMSLYNRTVSPTITWDEVLDHCEALYRLAGSRQHSDAAIEVRAAVSGVAGSRQARLVRQGLATTAWLRR